MITFSSPSISAEGKAAIKAGTISFSSIQLVSADTRITLPIEAFQNRQDGFVSLETTISNDDLTADFTVTTVEIYIKSSESELLYTSLTPDTFVIPQSGTIEEPHLKFILPVGTTSIISNQNTIYAPINSPTFQGTVTAEDIHVNGKIYLSDGSYLYVEE